MQLLIILIVTVITLITPQTDGYKPVMFLHGYNGSSESWGLITNWLSQAHSGMYIY